MSTEAEEIHRIVSASVRDMLDAYRIQASAGPVTDKALEEILFRAPHGVLQSLASYPREQRVALLPSVVRLLLTAFVEEVAGAGGSTKDREGGVMRENGLDWTWESGSGDSVQIGYVNSNGQRCGGHRGVLGTDYLQYAYKVECTRCGYVYGANGTDLHKRLFPECQGGLLEGPRHCGSARAEGEVMSDTFNRQLGGWEKSQR